MRNLLKNNVDNVDIVQDNLNEKMEGIFIGILIVVGIQAFLFIAYRVYKNNCKRTLQLSASSESLLTSL